MTFPSYLPVTAEFFNVSVSFPSLSPEFDIYIYIYYNIKTRKADIHAQSTPSRSTPLSGSLLFSPGSLGERGAGRV